MTLKSRRNEKKDNVVHHHQHHHQHHHHHQHQHHHHQHHQHHQHHHQPQLPPHQQHITAQDQKIYTLLARVPKGRVTTYGELAKAAGIKNGQRAIGRIMNKNPYPVIIPCHRVVRSTGQIGGYAYGTNIKENMLTKEGISISNEKITDIKNVMYKFN